MNDVAYRVRLLEALQEPGAHGIDQHDGFGTEVRVEGLDVVAGVHGDELVVTFVLEVPPGERWSELPRRSTLTLPFAAEWRDASGYEDPGVFARYVAHRTEVAAGAHVEKHRDGPRPAVELPGRREQWALLLGALAVYGEVRELSGGQLRVTDPETPEFGFNVLIDAEQWEQVLLKNGTDDIDMYVDEVVGPREADEDYVVVDRGDLHRSIRAELPPVRSRAFERLVQKLHAEGRDGPAMGWYAHPPE